MFFSFPLSLSVSSLLSILFSLFCLLPFSSLLLSYSCLVLSCLVLCDLLLHFTALFLSLFSHSVFFLFPSLTFTLLPTCQTWDVAGRGACRVRRNEPWMDSLNERHARKAGKQFNRTVQVQSLIMACVPSVRRKMPCPLHQQNRGKARRRACMRPWSTQSRLPTKKHLPRPESRNSDDKDLGFFEGSCLMGVMFLTLLGRSSAQERQREREGQREREKELSSRSHHICSETMPSPYIKWPEANRPTRPHQWQSMLSSSWQS